MRSTSGGEPWSTQRRTPAWTSRPPSPSRRSRRCTPARRRPTGSGSGACDGRSHLPRGVAPGTVGGDGARRPGLHPGRGRGDLRGGVQGHGGVRQAVRRGAGDRHADLRGGDRGRGGRGASPCEPPRPRCSSSSPFCAPTTCSRPPPRRPATALDAKGLIKASVRDDDPVIYLEHKWLYRRIKEQLPEGEEVLTPIGEARLAREGRDLSIISYGATLWKSLEAAEQLERDDGLAVEVLDLRTLLPLDDAAIMRTVKHTNKVLIVHEDTRTGGLAGEIAARINEQAFEWLDGPIMRVTAHDVPLPYAPTLEDFVLPQTEDIVKAARWLAAY